MPELTNAIDFIDRVKSLKDADEISGLLSDFAHHYGYDGYVMTGVPMPGEALDPYLMMKGMNPDWQAKYLAEDYAADDPVVTYIRQSIEPFEWNQAAAGAKRNSRALGIMEEAASYGMPDGFCVPIYTLQGFQAVVTFGGSKSGMTTEEKGSLHLGSIYAHSRMRELLAKDVTDGQIVRQVKLTPRELECLKWTSEGKTSWEIATILGISQHTVDWYIASAQKKVGAVNRPHLVAEGFRLGALH